jgi:lipopolysaccharide export system permease protein
MKTLRRYILLELAGPFLFSLSLLTFILFMRQMVFLFPKFAGKNLGWTVISELMLLSLPFILALVLPMSVLVATIMAFGRLSSDNEITALKALGVPAHRLMAAPMGAALVLMLGAIWFNDRVLPESNHRYKNLLVDIAYLKPTLRLEEGVIMDAFPGMGLMVNRIRETPPAPSLNPVGSRKGETPGVALEQDRARPAELFGVIITQSDNTGINRTILADSGYIHFTPDQKDAFLTLFHGEIQEVDKQDPNKFQRLFFTRHQIRLPNVGGLLERDRGASYRGDRELTLRMLTGRVQERKAEIDSLARLAATIADSLPQGDTLAAALREACGPDIVRGLGALKRYPEALTRYPDLGARLTQNDPRLRLGSLIRETAFDQRRIASLEVEWWKKLSIPFASLIFVLLGVPIGILSRRGGAGVSIAISMGVFLCYWIFLVSGETLADRMLISPFCAMWLPNLVFLLIGLDLLAVQIRGSRSVALARGGLSLNPRSLLRPLLRPPDSGSGTGGSPR